MRHTPETFSGFTRGAKLTVKITHYDVIVLLCFPTKRALLAIKMAHYDQVIYT